MEKPTKRSQPVFNSHYPPKKELEHYLDTDQFDKFNERIKDMTLENAMMDAEERRVNLDAIGSLGNFEKLPNEILEKVALAMDVRDLLNAAQKSFLIATFTASDKFWRQKFVQDFPELATRTFELHERLWLRWKKAYFVFRYLMKQWFVKMIQQGSFNYAVGQVSVVYNFKQGNVAEKSVRATWRGKAFQGTTTQVTFDEIADAYCKRIGRTRTNYFFTVDDSRSRFYQDSNNFRDNYSGDNQSGIRLLYRFIWVGSVIEASFPQYGSDRILNLEQLLERGYVKKNDDGVPFIGEKVCKNCSEPAKVFDSKYPNNFYCGEDVCYF